MHQSLRIALAAACLTGAGCQSAPAPGSVGGVSGGADAATNPADVDWRRAWYAEAIAGLRFEAGRVTIDPGSARAADAKAAEARRIEADALARGGHHVEAIGAWRDAILLAPPPGQPAAYIGLGEMLRLKGKSDEAVAAFRTAIDLDGAGDDAWFDLAVSLWRRGDRIEAREAMVQVTVLNPARGDAHAQLARWCYYLEDDAAAWRHLRQAEALGAPMPSQFRPLLEKRTAEPALAP